MEARMGVLMIIIGMVASLASVAYAIPGTATFYTPPYSPNACIGVRVNGTLPLIAAASNVIWDNGAACGRNYRVTCTGTNSEGIAQPCRGSVVVQIIDYCPPGCRATFDLSQEAFALIADPNAGKVNIDYEL
nr:EG45-like domain containing protein [Coffea arabica]